MSGTKIAALGLLALVLMCAFAPGSASAEEIEGCKKPVTQPKCLVVVEGKKLVKEQKEEVSTKAKEALTFTGKLAGQSVEIRASSFNVEKGAAIKGGNPAEGQGTVELGGIKVEKPTGCEIEGAKIKTNSLGWWYVWLYVGVFYHGVDVVWLPFIAKGGALFTFKLKGEKCALNGTTVEAAGVMLSKTTEKEALAQTLTFAKIEEGGVLYEFGGTVGITPKLTFNKEPFTVTGAVEMELVSKKKLGID